MQLPKLKNIKATVARSWVHSSRFNPTAAMKAAARGIQYQPDPVPMSRLLIEFSEGKHIEFSYARSVLLTNIRNISSDRDLIKLASNNSGGYLLDVPTGEPQASRAIEAFLKMLDMTTGEQTESRRAN